MGKRQGMHAQQACAAAVSAAFSFCALAQGALAPQAAIERAQATGVLAGLHRALSTPLEIVWLRTAAEIETWSNGELSRATVGRTGWRYIFGGSAQFAPAPNEVARLVVSSLKLPKAPLTTGKVDLAGSGRLFVIAPEAPAASADVALILAAGSTLQISDAASPGLQVELKAPAHRALLLGNLASTSVHKMLALLVKPNAVNASEASVSDGKVALRSGGEMVLAALVDGRSEPLATQLAVAPAPAPEPIRETAQDIAVATIEAAPLQTPIQSVPEVVASVAPIETPIATVEPVEAPIEMAAAPSAPVVIAPIEPPVAVAIAPVAPIEAPIAVAAPAEATPVPPTPIQTAALHIESGRAQPSVPKAASPSADVARMRAEVEAEIARDQERLAQQRTLAAPAGKRFVLGV